MMSLGDEDITTMILSDEEDMTSSAQWMVAAQLAKGHNMTNSKLRLGGSAVQVTH